ncbi:MAG: hypothetical protein PF444_00075 [Bacteroidales bacterium]|jgi:ribosomal protein S8|nr:hypothetical protein [Bacteroidales bacterium]
METNDLRGLKAEGFTEETTAFDAKIFNKAESIDKIRKVIKTYLRKTDTTNYDNSSYGLKHIIEKHIGFYVSNGEVIYAMHLEGFKIEKGSINCLFNVSKAGIRLLKNSNEIKDTLKIPAFYNADDYLTRKKTFLKYKYTFNSLIDCRFANNVKLKRYVYTTIAIELGQDVDSVIKWINIFNSEKTEIPEIVLSKLCKIFNLKEGEMLNPKMK